MSARENLNPQQFFHGTQEEVSPGDVIKPAVAAGKDINFPGLSSPEHAYATKSKRDAKFYGSHGGSYPDTNVYKVAPVNPADVEPDPNEYAANPRMHKDFRSKSGFKVVS